MASASATPLSWGEVLGSATRKTCHRLAEALRLAAFGLEMAKCRPGEYCRRMKGRLGKAEGITATAHKLARVIYAMIASGRGYDEAEAFRKTGVEQKQLTPQDPSRKARFPTRSNPASYNELVRRQKTEELKLDLTDAISRVQESRPAGDHHGRSRRGGTCPLLRMRCRCGDHGRQDQPLQR